MDVAAHEAPRRILIVKPSSLGDVVHALPALAGLRRAYPQAHIAWLLSTSFAPLLDGHPLLNEVIRFDRRRYGRMLRSLGALRDFWRFVRDLRRRHFDLVLDLQGLFRSGFLTWATGTANRVGFADARELGWLFYNRRVVGPAGDAHAVEKNLCLARALGLPVDPPEFPLALNTTEHDATRRLLSELADRPIEHFIALVVGARWDSKRWRAARLAALVNALAQEGLPPVVLLGAPDDRAFADQITAHISVPVVDAVGRTTLRQLCAALSLADLVICHDSGPMHVAAALSKPIVAIFGPTNPARTGPFCNTARVVSLGLSCAPCYERTCPLQHHNCMAALDAELVLRHVRDALATAASPSG